MSPRVTPQRLAEIIDGGIILTDEQVEVIGAPMASRLVVAGAGAGKTFVMALRVVYLAANGLVRPDAILGLTFTRKAAAELGRRIRVMLARLPAELVGDQDAAWPVVSTYDAYASSLVRSYGLQVGADPDARILTQAQRWQLAVDVVEGWAGDPDLDTSAGWLANLLMVLADQTADNEVEPDRLIEFLDDAICDLAGKPPGLNPETGRPKKALPAGMDGVVRALKNRRAAAELIDRYRARKLEQGAMDFADQAAWARRLTRFELGEPASGSAVGRNSDSPADRPGGRDLPANPVAQAERDRFKAVVLDEFQDTSAAQIDFLSALFGRLPVMAVGDPNQSIYGWRGASATALAAFLDRFGAVGPDGAVAPTTVLPLSVARRNDRAILDVANRVSAPLRRDSPVDLPELEPRAEAGAGRVNSAYFETRAAEAQVIAAYLSEHWARWLDGPSPRTAAVLVRTGAQIDPIAAALAEAGLEYQIIGRGGLLRAPEVRDVVSALAASQDLTRGDAFMRLAASPRFALGIKDLDGLARLARQGGDAPVALGQRLDSTERLTALDALESIMAGEIREDCGISPEGLRRLRRIGRVLRRIRQAAAYLSLPELVLETERALGLDIDLMAAPGAAGRSQINQLTAQAHAYAQNQEQVSLTGFLNWLEAEEEHADGLELADVPAPDGAIQVLTVHGAKGLEWDVVCVPGLVQGGFPAVGVKEIDGEQRPVGLGWLSDARRSGSSGGLPWPLRLDRAALPAFEHRTASDVVELGEVFDDFKGAVGNHLLAEERRVAYVAVTRAKTHLFLSGSWSTTTPKAGNQPSVFLQELLEAGLVDAAPWAEDPGEVPPEQASESFAVWPPEQPAGRRGPALARGAAAVARAGRDLPGGLRPAEAIRLLGQMDSDLAARAALLLGERELSAPERVVALPLQSSATALVSLISQPDEALERLRRPVPAQPSRGAGLGEEFHRRVALELAAAGRQRVHQDMLDAVLLAAHHADSAAEAQLNRLMDRFRQSRWMSGTDTLVAVETELEIELLGRSVVARIDAVFRDQAGRTIVVDWKTGRSDRGQAKPAHLDQVRLYQAALARQEGVSPEQIGGYVHYIMEDLSVAVDCPPDHLRRLAARLAVLA
ncbi:MAG: ATP-dependent helicase [Bifidobacteriaceae bacterium]|nr:ATP-dependent helicase [Bifidobacteriaceae bacterium]